MQDHWHVITNHGVCAECGYVIDGPGVETPAVEMTEKVALPKRELNDDRTTPRTPVKSK